MEYHEVILKEVAEQLVSNDKLNIVEASFPALELFLTLKTSGLDKLISATGPLAILLNMSGNLTNISEARLHLQEKKFLNKNMSWNEINELIEIGYIKGTISQIH
jgi:hypothetical protein